MATTDLITIGTIVTLVKEHLEHDTDGECLAILLTPDKHEVSICFYDEASDSSWDITITNLISHGKELV